MSEAAYDIQVHLERWRDNAQGAVDTFAALRQKTEESSRRLESPPGVLQFIDFFSMFFADAAAVFERVRAELEQAPLGVHAEALRQVASNAALEQRRCLQFRDKWINRPLPYEDVRPLLTDIVNTAANAPDRVSRRQPDRRRPRRARQVDPACCEGGERTAGSSAAVHEVVRKVMVEFKISDCRFKIAVEILNLIPVRTCVDAVPSRIRFRWPGCAARTAADRVTRAP